MLGGSKIALLFLTRGEIHHEELWKLWLRSAASYLPLSIESSAVCSLDEYDLVIARKVCGTQITANNNSIPESKSIEDDAFASQHLFNVYVHLAQNVDGMFVSVSLGLTCLL